ncbi:MAG: ROK family protein, partial [Propionibacteriaceae bacterium]|nr:ROK family protein [Propionibacteriaceae bacterium]
RANVVESRIVPIADREPEAVVEVVAALASELGAGVDKVSALGVSAGGLTEDYKILRQAAYMGWEDDVPLARMLEEATGLPSAVDNDVAAWTEAERWFGSGKNRPDFALVTTGAGIGYSLVSQGNLVAGREVGVGSLAHVPLDPLGPPCSQGHHGCAEAMLTTDAITKQVSLALGRPVEYAEALELSQNGNPAARSTVRAAARAYGRLLALVANTTFSPYIIVSGEGVDLAIDQKELVLDEFQAGRHPCAQHVEIELKPAPFTEWARGAAVTAIQTYVLGRA